MKITENQGPSVMQKEEKPGRQGGASDVFRKIMDDVMNETACKEARVEGGTSLPPPCGVEILSAPQSLGAAPPFDHLSLIGELDQTLELADFYAEKLGDSATSSRSLEALVGHLEDRVSSLKDFESDPGLPPDLKRLVSDVGFTIGKEILRFNRGDYS